MKTFESVQYLLGRKKSEQMTLSQLVTLVADKPTTKNRNAFYRSLLVSKVGTRIQNTNGSFKPGTHVTTKEEQALIPTTIGPDGTTMILVYCDIPGMFAAYPRDAFIELDGRIVLEMAEKKNFGIIVQNLLGGNESWAGVPKEHVADILGGKYGTG
jgi:hypothetical protein